jgi:hypothetical protein
MNLCLYDAVLNARMPETAVIACIRDTEHAFMSSTDNGTGLVESSLGRCVHQV